MDYPNNLNRTIKRCMVPTELPTHEMRVLRGLSTDEETKNAPRLRV